MNFVRKLRIPRNVVRTSVVNIATKPTAFSKLYISPDPAKPIFSFSKTRHTFERRFSSKQASDVNYETASDETLESLSEHFEELFENDARMAKADVALASGVLKVSIPNHGTFVINKQTPNKQIWLSSPISGPYRFDLVPGKGWVYKHTGETLHNLLNQEVGHKILGIEKPGFDHCYFASGLVH